MHFPYAQRHQMVRYNIPRALEPLENTSFTSATSSTSATATTAPHHDSKGQSPTAKAVIASVISCFGVVFLISLGIYFYRRRRPKYNTKGPGYVFDKDAFTDVKKFASSPELNKYLVADLTKLNSSPVRPQRSPHEPPFTSTSKDRAPVFQPPGNSPFQNVNAKDEKTSILTFPKPIAEKVRPPRPIPTWLNQIMEEEARSQTAYAMSRAGQEIPTPVPPQTPPKKRSKAIPTPLTLSATRKSHASVRSKASTRSLVIPDHEPVPVISPARSESFAPKDLILPSPIPLSISDSARNQTGSPRVEHDTDVKLARLMSVVAPFTPNLPDELHVKVGDAVRIIEEYKDGWCFAQFIGRKDAPKGVVPLVCLQERRRLVPLTPNNSATNPNRR